MNTSFLNDLAGRLIAARAKVTEQVMTAARLHFIDAVCVGIAGSRWGSATGVVELRTSEGPSAILGTNRSTTPEMAALINGSLIHSLEYDDTHTESVVHGSSVVAPVALAVAQQQGSSITDMLSAFAVGWELLIRMGLSDPGALQRRGFQVTPAAGVFAAASVSAGLTGDDPDTYARALSIAGSMASGTLAPAKRGDSAKAVQPGWAGHGGILAADLARVGISGPVDVFEGPLGFFELYGGRDRGTEFMELCQEVGDEWLLPAAAFKLYPCCHYLHPFIEAALSLRGAISNHSEVSQVTCWVPEPVISIVAEPWEERSTPQTTQEARWSLPYVLATAMIDGTVDLDTFRGQPREDVIDFAQRISYQAWTDSGFPQVFPAKIVASMTDGVTVEFVVDDVKGNSDRAFSEEDVYRKARANLASSGFTSDRIDDLFAVFADGHQHNTAELSRILIGSDYEENGS